METSATRTPSVSVFQNQMQNQQNTPMEQQEPQQDPQRASLFQSLQNPTPAAPSAQQTGLLLCTTDLSPQALPPALLFSTQGPDAAPLGPVAVPLPQPDSAEPMSFQDQSSAASGSASGEARQLFPDQQPMQVGPSRGPPADPDLFLPQTPLSGLQTNMGSQDLRGQAAASGTTIFVVQGMVGPRAPEPLFQTAVGGGGAPPGQTNIFVFGLQNDSSQLLGSSGAARPGPSQNQNQTSAHLQPLLDPPGAPGAAPMHSSLQNSLQAQIRSGLEDPMQTSSQTALQASRSASSSVEKMEEILESLQKH